MPTTANQTKAAKAGTVGLVFLGLLQAIQAADPNIASTALLSAGTALNMGTLSALAASISTFILAATVITTGMLADRLGRKKVLLAALLISAVGDPITSTSANRPGVPPAMKAKDVLDQWHAEVARGQLLLLDGGELSPSAPSTDWKSTRLNSSH